MAMADSHPKVKIGSLNSWKEIAVYLDRGIRTVQRWERELGLPVHRIGKGPRSPVHAFPSELQAWLLRVSADHAIAPAGHHQHSSHPDGAVAISRVLVRRSAALAKQMMDSLWIQRQRAEELLAALDHVRRTVQAQKRGWNNASSTARPFAGSSRPGSVSTKRAAEAGADHGKKRDGGKSSKQTTRRRDFLSAKGSASESRSTSGPSNRQSAQ